MSEITLTKTFYRVDMDEYSPGYGLRLVKTDGQSFVDNLSNIVISVKDSSGDPVSNLFTSTDMPEDLALDDVLIFDFTVNESVYNVFESYEITLSFAGDTAVFNLWFCNSDVDNLDLIPYRHRATSEVVNLPLRELRDGIKHSFCKIAELAESVSTALTVDASEDSGTYDRIVMEISLWSNDVNADIYYELTDDGSIPSTPAAGSTLYTQALELSTDPGTAKTYHLKAIAIKGGSSSSVESWTYVLDNASLTVTNSPAEGTYGEPQTISLTPSDSSAVIRYSVDGTTPTTSVGTIYNSVSKIFIENGDITLKYIAYTPTKTSIVYSKHYIVSSAALTIHASLPDGSTYSGGSAFGITISVFEGTTDVTSLCSVLKYTTDGSDPASGTSLSSPFSVAIDSGETNNATFALKVYAEKGAKDATETFSYTRVSIVYDEDIWLYLTSPDNAHHFTAGTGTDNIKPAMVKYQLADGSLHYIAGVNLDLDTLSINGETCYLAIHYKVDGTPTSSDPLITYATGYDLQKLADGESHLVRFLVEAKKTSDDTVVLSTSSTEVTASVKTYYYDTAPATNTTIDLDCTLTEPATTVSTYCSDDRTFSFTGILEDDGVAGTDVTSLSAFVVTYTVEKSVDGAAWADITSSVGETDGTWEGGDAAITLAGDTGSKTDIRIKVAAGGAVYTGGYSNASDLEVFFSINKRTNIPIISPAGCTFYDDQVVTIAMKYSSANASIYYSYTNPSDTPDAVPAEWTPYTGQLTLTDNKTVYAALSQNFDGTNYSCPASDTSTVSETFTKGDASLDVYFAENSSDGLANAITTLKAKSGQSPTVYMLVDGSHSGATKKYEEHDNDNYYSPGSCGGSEGSDDVSTVACNGTSTILSSGTTVNAGSDIEVSSSTPKIVKVCGAAEDGVASGASFVDVWFSGIREITGSANVFDITNLTVTVPGGAYITDQTCNCNSWLTGSSQPKFITLKGIGLLTDGMSVTTVSEPTGFSMSYSILGSDSVNKTSICLKLITIVPKTSTETAHYTFNVKLDYGTNEFVSFDLYVYGGLSTTDSSQVLASNNMCNIDISDMKYSLAVADDDYTYHDSGTEHSLGNITLTAIRDLGYPMGCGVTEAGNRAVYFRFYGSGITNIVLSNTVIVGYKDGLLPSNIITDPNVNGTWVTAGVSGPIVPDGACAAAIVGGSPYKMAALFSLTRDKVYLTGARITLTFDVSISGGETISLTMPYVQLERMAPDCT